MNKIFSLLAFFVAAVSFVNAQDVNIPDANFKTALVGNSGINTNNDGEIQVSEAAVYTGDITVDNLAIADLTGIEAFTQLTSLNCGYNSLTTLDVSSNSLLTSLRCEFNQITALDVSILSNLSYFSCGSNKLTALNVSSNTALTDLYCGRNQISSLSISANTQLQTLNCSFNLITSLDVSANTGLLYLLCVRNKLTSLDISQNTALISVGCSSNLIGSLDISNNPALEIVQCNFCGISSLDVSTCPNLVTLLCSYNSISSLDVSANPALYLFYCNGNQLTSLDISANPDIHELDCSDNLLTSLNVNPQTALQYFSCGYNQLTALDVSANTALLALNCNSNQIGSLNLSTNTALELLNCSFNQISTLNLSANNLLNTLYCDNNNLLTSLDLRNGNNTGLVDFYAGDNPNLSCIDVDDVDYMNTNWSSAAAPANYSINCNCVPATITSTPSITSNLCPGTPVKLQSTSGPSYEWSNGGKRRSITVTKSGIYTVSTDRGCTSLPATVTYQPCGAPPVLGVSNVSGNSAFINFTPVSCGQTYDLRYKQVGGSWILITGITGNSYTLTNLLLNTEYIVQMRTKCSSSPLSYSSWTVKFLFRTSANFIASIENGQKMQTANSKYTIQIYPNPALSNAVLRISGHTGNVTVSISDLSGKQLWQSLNNASSQINLPVQNFAAGIYMVTVSDGDNKQVLKLVKE